MVPKSVLMKSFYIKRSTIVNDEVEFITTSANEEHDENLKYFSVATSASGVTTKILSQTLFSKQTEGLEARREEFMEKHNLSENEFGLVFYKIYRLLTVLRKLDRNDITHTEDFIIQCLAVFTPEMEEKVFDLLFHRGCSVEVVIDQNTFRVCYDQCLALLRKHKGGLENFIVCYKMNEL